MLLTGYGGILAFLEMARKAHMLTPAKSDKAKLTD
jgi:hypothetical protein